jgi:hypothetical protein
MSHFIIKKSTPDSEIATKLTPEEILGRFVDAKAHANRWDAERDKLRSFIQEHMVSGRYGAYVLDKTEGTARVYATSAGNVILQSGILIDPGLIPYPKSLKAGIDVKVIDAITGEVLRLGKTVDNKDCFSKKPPINLKITEVPEDESPNS